MFSNDIYSNDNMWFTAFVTIYHIRLRYYNYIVKSNGGLNTRKLYEI